MKNVIVSAVAATMLTLACVAIWQFGAGVAEASSCALKSWSQDDTLQSSDLNSNFTCINNGLRGSAGSLITATDISSSAAIEYTKLNLPSLYPQAWVSLGSTACTVNGACSTATGGAQRASVARTAAGAYTVTLGYTAPDAIYLASVSAQTLYPGGLTDGQVACVANTLTTTTFLVKCYCQETKGACTIDAAADATFTAIVFDNNNN